MIALFAEAPALPLHTAGPYVAAAYIVFLLIVLIYVWLMARKLINNSRELRELRAQVEERAQLEERGSGTEAETRAAIAKETDNDSDSHYQVELDETGAGTGGAGVQ
jgi:flagellar biosynthesis/type III secretory pathway M-ring protein FliF/YscJ